MGNPWHKTVAAIRRSYERGVKVSRIAAKFNLTVEEVREIVQIVQQRGRKKTKKC